MAGAQAPRACEGWHGHVRLITAIAGEARVREPGVANRADSHSALAFADRHATLAPTMLSAARPLDPVSSRVPCGVVLTGGHSRRMGRDKALLTLADGRTMAAWVIERLRSVCDPVLAIDPAPARLAGLGVTAFADDVAGRGPLGGLATALKRSPKPWVFVAGCDMPRLHPALIPALIARRGDADAVVPIVGDRWQTLAALYSTRLAAAAERVLARDRAGIKDLLREVQVRWVAEDELRLFDPTLASFTNVNTPADLEGLVGSEPA